jgi:hypothetical protein
MFGEENLKFIALRRRREKRGKKRSEKFLAEAPRR